MSEEGKESKENKEQKQENGESGDKVSKRFDQNVKKLIALFSGEDAFKKEKVSNSEISTIIAELTKEKKEALIKTFKEKATKLLTSKVEFDRFVDQKKKEMEQAITNKKKEFNNEMEECFKLVENIDNLQKDYQSSFDSLNQKPEETNNK